jgi:hypothetical protein
MRTSRQFSTVDIRPAHTLAVALVLGLALASPVSAARGPVPVSPGATAQGAAVEARCPTFQWAGVPAARGYELAVFRVSDDGAEPMLVTRASVPGDARGWTPPSSGCLERGERYAWSVATTGSGKELEWSSPFLFTVEAAPSLDELEQAIATIERYRRSGTGTHGAGEIRDSPERARGADTEDGTSRPAQPRRPHPAGALGVASGDALSGALVAPTSGIARVASEASTPTLGSPSLAVSANISLSAASNLFKNDVVFLWDDSYGNTALGREALASASGTASNNTAVGRQALQNTTAGIFPWYSSYNTAIGDRALSANLTGYGNTASGYYALLANTTGRLNTASGGGALRYNTTGSINTASGASALRSNTTGFGNTASGESALSSNTTGSRNTAVGRHAGIGATTGHDNIFIGSGATAGSAGEGNTIRIGGEFTGTAEGRQNRTFINGIRGITTAVNNAIPVLISSTGQLGTASSSRAVKQDIEDLGPLADRLLALRPVAFRYRQHAATDPDTPLQFGLIAEEVAEVFPELVVYDDDGKPETIKYHLLSSLLLGELQRLDARLELVEKQDRARRSRRGR